MAENALSQAKDMETIGDMNQLFDDTCGLQRHCVSSNVKDQFDKFPWLQDVSIGLMFTIIINYLLTGVRLLNFWQFSTHFVLISNPSYVF